jgi:hypothetical protein
MSGSNKKMQIAGFTLHVLIGGIMIAAGAPKVLGLAPPEHVERMGLTDHIRIVGAGEIISGGLLVLPQTLPLGILLTSSFWGGAICVHMTHGESYLVPSVLLVLTWIGAYLRPRATWQHRRAPEHAETGSSENYATNSSARVD